jgi:pyrimidine deaminase RibD-like protein
MLSKAAVGFCLISGLLVAATSIGADKDSALISSTPLVGVSSIQSSHPLGIVGTGIVKSGGIVGTGFTKPSGIVGTGFVKSGGIVGTGFTKPGG